MTLFSLTFFTVDLQAQDHFEEVIGTIKGGKATLTANKENIMKNWSSILSKESNIDITFSDVEILKVKESYLLVAKSPTYVSKIRLVEDNGNIHIITNGANNSISCTSADCSSTTGCVPLKAQCTDCDGDCVKVITWEYAKITEDRL